MTARRLPILRSLRSLRPPSWCARWTVWWLRRTPGRCAPWGRTELLLRKALRPFKGRSCASCVGSSLSLRSPLDRPGSIATELLPHGRRRGPRMSTEWAPGPAGASGVKGSKDERSCAGNRAYRLALLEVLLPLDAAGSSRLHDAESPPSLGCGGGPSCYTFPAIAPTPFRKAATYGRGNYNGVIR